MLTKFTRLPIVRAFTFAVILMALIVLPVFAAQTAPAASPLQPYLDLAATLVGFSALITVLINAAKYFGILQDGQSGLVSIVLNYGVLGLVVLGGAFGLDLTRFDTIAGTAASIITLGLSLFGQLVVSKGIHAVLKRTPVPLLNTSFSRPH